MYGQTRAKILLGKVLRFYRKGFRLCEE